MRQVGSHIRSNVVGYIAVFIALGGTAWAVGADSIRSRHIVDGAVRAVDVNPSQVQLRIDGTCPSGQAVRVVNLDGAVICEVDDAGGTPTGPAGGDLTGSYPDPVIGPGQVGTGEVANDSTTDALTGADVALNTLGSEDIRQEGVRGEDIDEGTLRVDVEVSSSNGAPVSTGCNEASEVGRLRIVRFQEELPIQGSPFYRTTFWYCGYSRASQNTPDWVRPGTEFASD
jgi:hypothetical protein